MKFIEDNIVLVYKPIGITCFGLIKLMRNRLKSKKIGHAGTLDPLASGLMILGINQGTKKLMNFMKLDKTYEFSVLLGVATDTDDLEGNIIETKEIQNFDENKIKKTVIGLIGEKELPVPAFSSIKVKGTRLYKIARKDRNFSNTPKKLMNIRSIEINDIRNLNKFIEVDIIAEVSSGTYIRSISKHIGQKLGLPAVVSKLERTKISEFSLADDEVNDDLDWIRENLGSTKIIVANHETTDRIGLT